MLEELLKLDNHLFRLINSGCQNPLFDSVLPLVRNSLFWVPFYLFLIVFGFVNYRKNVWWWILFAILTVWLTDFLSSNIIKENIFRLRPCNDPMAMARLLVSYCPQSSSFTSSHATNHFGLASFLFFTLSDLPRR